MPQRAPRPCTHPGCGAHATHHGRCEHHPHPHRWLKRPTHQQRYGLSRHRWDQLKARIGRRDQHRCTHCGQPGSTIDHITPIAEGGAPTDPHNLAVICDDCHTVKTRNEIARSNQRRAGKR